MFNSVSVASSSVQSRPSLTIARHAKKYRTKRLTQNTDNKVFFVTCHLILSKLSSTHLFVHYCFVLLTTQPSTSDGYTTRTWVLLCPIVNCWSFLCLYKSHFSPSHCLASRLFSEYYVKRWKRGWMTAVVQHCGWTTQMAHCLISECCLRQTNKYSIISRAIWWPILYRFQLWPTSNSNRQLRHWIDK